MAAVSASRAHAPRSLDHEPYHQQPYQRPHPPSFSLARFNFSFARLGGALILSLSMLATGASAASIDDSLKVVGKTTTEGVKSQQTIDKLAVQTRHLLEEYQRIVRNTEYQDAYNAELQQLADDQQLEINGLKQQLEDLKVTQMQIVPLMRTMADALEQFVVLDLPFHQQQRVSAVLQLKQRLRSPSLSVPDKFRMLLEAFQIENDYSHSLEAYRGPLSLDEQQLSVEFLRIGRVALYYKSLDGSQVGHWDTQRKNWQPLTDDYSAAITKGIRVAANQQAPELLSLPILPTPTEPQPEPQAKSEVQP